ncbi:MAG: DUF309 domain-containing protein [Planctomycetota bacterium]
MPPRYFPDLPFPQERYLPGKTIHPRKQAIPSPYESLLKMDPFAYPWWKHPSFYYGIDLFNQEFWWESHECWESLWIHLENPEKNFLQMLIQMSACCLTKILNRESGTKSLKLLVGQRFQKHHSFPSAHSGGIVVSRVYSQFLDHIEANGPPPIIELIPEENGPQSKPDEGDRL